MKKYSIILIICSVLSGITANAQSLSAEKCIPYTLDGRGNKVLGFLFYADKDYSYLTVNKAERYGYIYDRVVSGYMDEHMVGIDKFNKDMKRVASIDGNELGGDKTTSYIPLIMKDRFLFVTKTETKDGNYVYSTIIVDKDMKVIAKNNNVYTLKKDYMFDPDFYYSSDSSNVLLKFNKSLAGKKDPTVLVGIGSDGTKKFQKEVIFFEGQDQGDYGASDVYYDNKDIYIAFSTSVKSRMGLSATGKKTRNIFLKKYNIETSTFKEIPLPVEFDEYNVVSTHFLRNNNKFYLCGNYVTSGVAYAVRLSKYDGVFSVVLDDNEKVLSKNFYSQNDPIMNDDRIYNGATRDVFFKSDGGYYMVSEYRNCESFCNTGEIVVYNFDKDGKYIWRRAIEKDHHGVSQYNEDRFMFSYYFFYNDKVFVLFNDSKSNATVDVKKPLSQTKVWNKELSCFSYVFNNDGTLLKKVLFDSQSKGCKFQINNVYNNTYAKKILSLGDDDLINISYE